MPTIAAGGPRWRAMVAMGVFLLLGPTAGAVRAQTTGTIVGTVSQPGVGPVPGTSITARQADTGFVRTVVTGEDGRYAIAGLPVGPYELRAEIVGFKPLLRRGVELTVAETVVINFTLEAGDLSLNEAIVEVQGRAPLVNTQSPELSYLVSGQMLEALPLNGRNFTDLALLQPGVVAFPHRDTGSVVAHGVGVSINGQDPRSNVYLLDGTIQNDFTNGPAGSAAGTYARARGRARVPRRGQRLRCRVRPQRRWTDQRPHQVGHQPLRRQRL